MTHIRDITKMVALLLLLCSAATAPAMGPIEDPRYAVVRLKSHGASATVIATEPGRSWILGCCHAYFAQHGSRVDPSLLARPHKLDGPPQAFAPNQLATARVIAHDAQRDLSLIEVSNGPFYYCPIAPRGHRPGRCITVGFDEMKWPFTFRPATIIKVEGNTAWTAEPPWHGRSGGGLLDVDNCCLVGVVQAYTHGAAHRPDKGLHASLDSIHAFMAPYWDRCPADGKPGNPGLPQYAPLQLPGALLPGQPQQYPPLQLPGQRSGWLEIPREARVRNVAGNCAWCAIETLCRTHGISQGYGLSQGKHGTGPGEVAAALRARGIRFRQQQPGRRDLEIIQGEARQYGCLIGLQGSHAITCLGADGSTVKVIDNTGPRALEVQDWSLQQFQSRWDGWCCVVYPQAAYPQQQAGPSAPPRGPPQIQLQPCPGGT